MEPRRPVDEPHDSSPESTPRLRTVFDGFSKRAALTDIGSRVSAGDLRDTRTEPAETEPRPASAPITEPTDSLRLPEHRTYRQSRPLRQLIGDALLGALLVAGGPILVFQIAQFQVEAGVVRSAWPQAHVIEFTVAFSMVYYLCLPIVYWVFGVLLKDNQAPRSNQAGTESEPPYPGQHSSRGVPAAFWAAGFLLLFGWFTYASGEYITRPSTTSTPVRSPAPAREEPEGARVTAAFADTGLLRYVAERGYLETAGLNHAIETDTGVEAADLLMEAVFIPPEPAPDARCTPSIARCWDFGFVLRDSEPGRYVVDVFSTGEWEVNFTDRVSGTTQSVGNGKTDLVQYGRGKSNQLRFGALGTKGYLFLNSRYLATLDLSGHTLSGKVNAGVGLSTGGGSSPTGWDMEYRWLRIWTPA